MAELRIVANNGDDEPSLGGDLHDFRQVPGSNLKAQTTLPSPAHRDGSCWVARTFCERRRFRGIRGSNSR
ncbi:hypothetical protein MPL3356_270031 [Mesorhizobium plurifarium]|uniref:Uncharacterized protein n=1 Tax=Mesorhizobium plurifarium TaxID=69974 RepID=A0A090DV32_MESPL|nr:hypothetical protein MPL3356_270031 [Mesorhizobium plurifarium]